VNVTHFETEGVTKIIVNAMKDNNPVLILQDLLHNLGYELHEQQEPFETIECPF
jgi:hypothetical protein